MLEDKLGKDMPNSYDQDQRLKEQTHHHQSNRVRKVRTRTLDII